MPTPISVPIRIPSPLRPFTAGNRVVDVQAGTVADALTALAERHTELNARLRDPEGRLHRHVRVYVNDEDVRFLEGERTRLQPGDALSIVPAIAGG